MLNSSCVARNLQSTLKTSLSIILPAICMLLFLAPSSRAQEPDFSWGVFTSRDLSGYDKTGRELATLLRKGHTFVSWKALLSYTYRIFEDGLDEADSYCSDLDYVDEWLGTEWSKDEGILICLYQQPVTHTAATVELWTYLGKIFRDPEKSENEKIRAALNAMADFSEKHISRGVSRKPAKNEPKISHIDLWLVSKDIFCKPNRGKITKDCQSIFIEEVNDKVGLIDQMGLRHVDSALISY